MQVLPVDKYIMDTTKEIVAAYLSDAGHTVPADRVPQIVEDVHRKVAELVHETD